MLLANQLILGQPEATEAARKFKPLPFPIDTIIYLDIPSRPINAPVGSAFVNQVSGLSIIDRETVVVSEILSGNVPSFSRKLKAIKIIKTINGTTHELTYFSLCDYMAIGSDQDYFYIPMTPSTAQYLADHLRCTLPTKKMVDAIYSRAEFKLKPQPIPPSPAMTTIPVFWQHTDSIKQQIAQMGIDHSADSILGGTKKDIIISNKIYSPDRNYDRVVIYGWHTSVNNPIQPVYNGHIAMYADYSHGVRLIAGVAFLDGDSIEVNDILMDSTLWPLLSSEGVISQPYYPPSTFLTALDPQSENSEIGFQLSQNYPNPFNPTTTIEFTLPSLSVVTLEIFNIVGQRVVETPYKASLQRGTHKYVWNGKDDSGNPVASGIYLLRLKTRSGDQSRKMILMR